MATLYKMNKKERAAWRKWVASRPPIVRAIFERLPINKLYRLKTTGQRVTVASVNENGTVTVSITGQFNLVAFDTDVFGIDPIDLQECDLPPSDEPIGTMLTTEKEVRAYIDAIRPGILAARGIKRP